MYYETNALCDGNDCSFFKILMKNKCYKWLINFTTVVLANAWKNFSISDKPFFKKVYDAFSRFLIYEY